MPLIRAVMASSDRRGKVFVDRYHAEELGSVRQVCNAVAYVLNNWRKHREDLGVPFALDPFASGAAFAGWREPLDEPDVPEPIEDSAPRTWMLRHGWAKVPAISMYAVPGPRR